MSFVNNTTDDDPCTLGRSVGERRHSNELNIDCVHQQGSGGDVVYPIEVVSSKLADNEYDSFEVAVATQRGMNSSFRNDTILPSILDPEDLSSPPVKEKILQITSMPSMTSKGFENSFKLLKNQIDRTNRKTAIVMESVTGQAGSLNNTNDKGNNTFMAIDIQTKGGRVELELIARERIKRLQEENAASHSVQFVNFLSFLRAFSSLAVFSNDLVETSDFSNSNAASDSHQCHHHRHDHHKDIVYYASKRSDGKCLKIARNLSQNEVVSGKRVSQMTRVYDDIEAVTRLLEEKEKDLELTVQIGKELLTQNNCLEKRINDLESDLKTCKEAKAQILHELNKKTELIAVLTNDIDDSFDKESPAMSRSITMETLHKKISALQDENASLKVDALQLTQETNEAEEQERQLMKDIRLQLSETSSEYSHLTLELERQQEENRLQHEQIVNLTDRLADAEMKLHQLSHENDEHVSMLNITKENQNSLAMELVTFKSHYQEVLSLLKETQEQLRKQRKRGMPHARNSFLASSLFQPDSLCSELMESSLHSENSLDSGISTDTQRANERIARLLPNSMTLYSDDDKTQNIEYGSVNTGTDVSACSGPGARCNRGGGGGGGFAPPPPPSSYKKAFETVRYATKSGLFNEYGSVSMSEMGAMSMSSSSGMKMSSTPYIGSGTIHPPHCGADVGGSSSAVSHCYSYIYDGGTCLSEKGITLSDNVSSHSDDGYPSQSAGVPGTPGAKDLEDALKRLTTAEVLARRAMLSYAPIGTYTYDENPTSRGALGIRTPDSLMSTGSGSSGISSSSIHIAPSIHRWRLPDKLQIIKPMEGSQTLNHWSRLATPTLSGLLEERRGVTIRGGRALQDLGIQEYALSDVEEDIIVDLPGKQFEPAGCVYTFTTSTVMHPDDGFVHDATFLSQSQVSSRMASTSTSRQPSCPPTPNKGLSRRNSCSTFSVNMGLATVLNERGIKAVTPSALNTPAGPNFSPTVTPCNSPEETPSGSLTPEPFFGLLSSGAELLRRKFMGHTEVASISSSSYLSSSTNRNNKQKVMLSRLERRALKSLKLVEKVESIGLQNIISTQPSGCYRAAGVITQRGQSLTAQQEVASLKQANTTCNNTMAELHFNRDQIKGVLRKGLVAVTDAHLDLTTTKETKPHVNPDDGLYLAQSSSQSAAQSLKMSQSGGGGGEGDGDGGGGDCSGGGGSGSGGGGISDTRAKLMYRQRSRRNLKNGVASQRPDLGTSVVHVRKDLGQVSQQMQQQPPPPPAVAAAAAATAIPAPIQPQPRSRPPPSSSLPSCEDKVMDSLNDEASIRESQSIAQSFVGSISSLLFGRKGGWL